MSLNEALEWGFEMTILNLNVNQVTHNKLAWDPWLYTAHGWPPALALVSTTVLWTVVAFYITKEQLPVWSYSAWPLQSETLQYLWQPHAPTNPFITLIQHRITWDTNRTSGQASPHMFCLLIRHASCEGEQCTIPQHNGSNSIWEVQLVILSVFPVRKMDTYLYA